MDTQTSKIEDNTNILISSASCSNCKSEIHSNAKYCPVCGARLDGYSLEKSINRGQDMLLKIVVYYFLLVALICSFKFSNIEYNFPNLIIVDIIFSVITIVFTLISIRSIIPLYSVKGIKLRLFPVLLLIAVAFAFGVFYFAEYFNFLFFKDIYRETYVFYETRNPLLYAIISIAIQPAIFEEMAFRGFIFNDLLTFTSSFAVVMITTLLFGILHFSAISLVWLLPLGFVLGYLRNKYNIIWYSMFFHFTYNLSIVIIEMYIEKI